MCMGGRRWTCDVFIIVVMKILLFSRDFFYERCVWPLKMKWIIVLVRQMRKLPSSFSESNIVL